MKYGILEYQNGQNVVACYDNATDMTSFASEHLKSIMESEGYQLNDMVGYLQGWLESINECRDGEGEETDIANISGEVADNLTYCNVTLLKSERDGFTSLSGDDKSKFFDAIVEVLERQHFLGTDEQEVFIKSIKGTQFESDLNKAMGGVGSKGMYNLIVSIRDCKLWNRGMKPTRSWKVSHVKAYFGIKGKKETLAPQLESFLRILKNEPLAETV